MSLSLPLEHPAHKRSLIAQMLMQPDCTPKRSSMISIPALLFYVGKWGSFQGKDNTSALACFEPWFCHLCRGIPVASYLSRSFSLLVSISFLYQLIQHGCHAVHTETRHKHQGHLLHRHGNIQNIREVSGAKRPAFIFIRLESGSIRLDGSNY